MVEAPRASQRATQKESQYRPDRGGRVDLQCMERPVSWAQEQLHSVRVVLAGVRVGDLGLEELLPGELGRLTGGLMEV